MQKRSITSGLLTLAVGGCLAGCVDRDAIRIEMADVVRAEVKVQVDAEVAVQVGAFQTKIATGDIAIGGGAGDGVVDWLREVGLWVFLAMLYYPLVHRPLRRWTITKDPAACIPSPLSTDTVGGEWTSEAEKPP